MSSAPVDAQNVILLLQWDKGRIVGIGWTNTEHLMCVLENGAVRVYDIHGEFVQFSLGQVHGTNSDGSNVKQLVYLVIRTPKSTGSLNANCGKAAW